MSAKPNEDLTEEQAKILEKAAHLVIGARAEARAMLTGAGIELPPEPGPFGSPCGVMSCGCSNYSGDGGSCTTPVSGPGGGVPTDMCGHLPSQHLPT